MKFVYILFISALLFLLYLAESRKLNKDQKKERAAFITFIAIDWLLAVLLILYPNLPSPTQLLNGLFDPINGFLK